MTELKCQTTVLRNPFQHSGVVPAGSEPHAKHRILCSLCELLFNSSYARSNLRVSALNHSPHLFQADAGHLTGILYPEIFAEQFQRQPTVVTHLP